MDWKRIGKKLLFPPVWLMILLSVASAAMLVLVFVRGWEETPLAYGVYVLSFYTLCVVTVFCVQVLPKQLRRAKQKLSGNPLVSRYTADQSLRGKMSLYLGLCSNLIYVGINLLSWYLNQSWWFMVLAVYYVIMSTMWSLLVSYVRKNELGSSLLKEWRRARLCACVLLLVNLSLSGAVLMILYQSKGYRYPGILIYVMALYTFYSTIHAIMEMARNRSSDSPILSTANIVSLSAALVSMLNLETAMFAQFGQDLAPAHQRIFIILTGAGVSIAVVSLSVLRIVKATKEIRREEHGK